MRISGRVAIISGGASGLGEAVVLELHEAGAGGIVILDRDEEKGKALAERLGDRVHFCACDVTSEEEVQRAIALAEGLGDIRVVYNAAGVGLGMKTVGKKGAHDFDLFKRVISINLFGTFNVIRLAAEAMSKLDPIGEERGVIINTASIAAFEGQQGQAAYSASKGGIVGMTLPIARDLARVSIRVNTIAPGIFKTPLLGGLPEEGIELLSRDIEFPKRLGDPKELAHLVCFLVENVYMNGETVRCDGAARLRAR